MQQSRRIFLQSGLAAGTISLAAAAGMLTPGAVLASWPRKAFEATSMKEAVLAIAGQAQASPSDAVTVRTPDIAENGAVVSVTVEYRLPNAESISILVPENNNKLAASYRLSGQINSFVSSRIKMRKTSDVVAIVRANGKLYSNKSHVKVTLGGCGG